MQASSLLTAFFVCVGLLAIAPRAYCDSRVLRLLRVLFPSWRFFEQVSELPVLELRWGEAADALCPWQPALRRPRFSCGAFVLNPAGNLFLAEQSLLEQLQNDLGDVSPGAESEFEQSVSFRLCRSLAEHRLSDVAQGSAAALFQFRLVRVRQGANEPSEPPFLVSRILKRAANSSVPVSKGGARQ